MVSDFDSQVARLGSGQATRSGFIERYAAARSDRASDNVAAVMLDALAQGAPANPVALEVLLQLVRDHRLARPAIHKVLLTEQDVADAEQATLASVALGIGGFAGRSRFTTWLHQIALNEARLLVRSRERRVQGPHDELDRPEAAFFARLSTIVGDRDVIVRALKVLPEHFREVVVLRELEGLSYEEIAELLDVPLGTVRSRLNRGRDMLAAAVATATE